MSLESLDTTNKNDVDAVASLHETYLSDSPIALMGPRFLRRFYYVKLVNQDLVQCIVCRVNGRVVGFLSYTSKYDFMATGIKRNWLLLSWVMLVSILTQPSVLKNILWTIKLMGMRSNDLHEPDMERTGESLSMAVEPEFQTFVPAGGTSRLPVRLFEHMVEYFRKEGIERIVFMVRPENIASNIYYNALGCEMQRIQYAGLWIHRYTYEVS